MSSSYKKNYCSVLKKNFESWNDVAVGLTFYLLQRRIYMAKNLIVLLCRKKRFIIVDYKCT